MKTALVDAFPSSTTRAAIYEGWSQHRMAVDEIAPIKKQWLNGSFVSTKVDPADLDVVTFFDAADIGALPKHRALLLKSLMLDKYTRHFWGCDSYPLPEPAANDPAHAQFLRACAYWDSQWGHDRAGTPKGYLEIT